MVLTGACSVPHPLSSLPTLSDEYKGAPRHTSLTTLHHFYYKLHTHQFLCLCVVITHHTQTQEMNGLLFSVASAILSDTFRSTLATKKLIIEVVYGYQAHVEAWSLHRIFCFITRAASYDGYDTSYDVMTGCPAVQEILPGITKFYLQQLVLSKQSKEVQNEWFSCLLRLS